MNFVVLVGLYWGDVIVEAAFLRQVGVEFLPLLIIGSAVCSIIAIVIYTAFADQVTNDRLLIAILAISVVGIAIGLVLLGWGLVTITYPLLYLVANVPLRDILNVHWATYVNGFYDTRAAKQKPRRLASRGLGAMLNLLAHVPGSRLTREGQTRLVAGRSSGFRVARPQAPMNLPSRQAGIWRPHPSAAPSHPDHASGQWPMRRSWGPAVRGPVAGYSGASAADSHGLPS